MNTPARTASQQLAEALHTQIPEERLAEVLSSAMSATMTTRAGAVEPDHKTRVQAATLVLAYKVGRPVERQEVVSVNVCGDPDADFAARLKRSPALRRALRMLLAESEE